MTRGRSCPWCESTDLIRRGAGGGTASDPKPWSRYRCAGCFAEFDLPDTTTEETGSMTDDQTATDQFDATAPHRPPWHQAVALLDEMIEHDEPVATIGLKKKDHDSDEHDGGWFWAPDPADDSLDLSGITPDVGDVDLRVLDIVDDDLSRFCADLASGLVAGPEAAERLKRLMDNDPRIMPPITHVNDIVVPDKDEIEAAMPDLTPVPVDGENQD